MPVFLTYSMNAPSGAFMLSDKLKSEYIITKVIEHRKGMRQVRLSFD